MKSWKTTLSGIVVGLMPILDAVDTAYKAGAFSGKTGGELIAGIGIVIFGVVSKDHNVTGGTK
jgi:hypothetical protein